MLTFVYGGSRAGKSTWAEGVIARLPNREKIYIAAMKPIPHYAESIVRQRLQREKLGFTETIETPRALFETAGLVPDGSAALLECLCNLVSNELFPDEGGAPAPESVIDGILQGIDALSAKCSLYVVSNEVASDGVEYDAETELYIKTLSRLNRLCAARADEVYEVVCGLPLRIK